MSSHCVRWGIRSDGPDTILKANFGQKRCDFGQKSAILGKKSDKLGIGPFSYYFVSTDNLHFPVLRIDTHIGHIYGQIRSSAGF